jgi:hypothetical protein
MGWTPEIAGSVAHWCALCGFEASMIMALVDNRALLAAPNVPLHQQQVDLIQAEIRADLLAGRRSLFKPAPPGPRPSDHVLDERIAEELDLMIRQLAQLGDIIADDPILLHRHAAQLQSVDLVQQVLGHLGRVVAAADKSMAVECITLSELKARLKRKALRPIAD